MRFWILLSIFISFTPMAQANVLGTKMLVGCVQNFSDPIHLAICNQSARSTSGLQACVNYFGARYEALACAANAESEDEVKACVDESLSSYEALECIESQSFPVSL